MKHIAHRLLKLQDNVNTDYIISGRYKFRIQDPRELAKHVFEDIEDCFYKKVHKGDFLISGENFGCGSSREQAPLALKATGLTAVVAKSFARIFYRNSINVGLPILECKDVDLIKDRETLAIDVSKGLIKSVTSGRTFYSEKFPGFLKDLIGAGGLINWIKKGEKNGKRS